MSLLGDELSKLNAWLKADTILGEDSSSVRCDVYGRIIRYREYGKTTEFGWEIDHHWPVSLGGTNANQNLRALHWRSNRIKSDKIEVSLGGLLNNLK
jgi:hypothetical protein